MKIAVVGATGMVGAKIIEILEESNFPLKELIPVASAASAGKQIRWKSHEIAVVTIEEALSLKPNLAFFTVDGELAGKWAPKFVEGGCRVIDNSSHFRMDKNVKLIVPQVNGNTLTGREMLIANPNCSTIQLVIALNLLHKRYRISRVIVSTYQSVSGSGVAGCSQLEVERKGQKGSEVGAYPWPIDLNLIPHIDSFLESGYTKEEMKIVDESRKIFDSPQMAISATAVRVPVTFAHSESVNVQFERDFTLEQVVATLKESPQVELLQLSDTPPYPMPLYAEGSDTVFVGRVRGDLSCEKAINLWVVADNLRVGAATNGVAIARKLLNIS
ncbi:MAG: aspartate-semialdehyde dehydrogenase [Bacteroidales bacterium]